MFNPHENTSAVFLKLCMTVNVYNSANWL